MLALAAPGEAADKFNSAYISEFLADNQHGLQDDDGDHSGWIELHNGGTAVIDLTGWFLTDTVTNLAKWRFPTLSLLPDHFMVVFASAKARTNDLSHLHTNFRLDKQGSYLALVSPATNVVSEFAPAYPRQTADTSYGRVQGEAAIRGYFQRPTPGKPNAINGPGFASALIFSRSSGSFTAPFSLQLSNRSPKAVIRYTLNGKLPSSRSAVYGAPLLITNTTCVRARAYEDGLLPGPPRSETYLLLETNVLDFSSTLPVLVMDTLGQNLQTSSRSSFVQLSFYEPFKGRTCLTNPPGFTTRGGFHIRGSTSGGMPKSGFAVQFLDEFDQERHHSALGLPSDSDWVLYAPNAYEPVMIHNPFVHQLSRDMGRYSPRTRFLEVYLLRHSGPVTALDYNGIYVLEEKIKTGKHRVDIDRIGPTDLKPPGVTGGYVLKFDRLGAGEAGFTAGGASLVYVEPKELLITLPQRAAQKQYLDTFFNDFDRALNGPNWKDPLRGYRAYIDADAAIDYHVLEVLSGNVDALVLSAYFHKPRNGKIILGPHWDFDRALGSTDGRDDNPRQWSTGPFFGGAWWPKMFSDPDFWQQWVDRWQELRGSHFSLTNLNNLIDRLTDELREAQPREVTRWNLQPRGGTYQTEIDVMKTWLSNRVDFIDHELVPPPGVSRLGGVISKGFVLTLTAATNATVYYTLDGSDPRLSQGVISSNAIIYTGPIQMSANGRLKARARDPNQRQTGGPPSSTPWSSPVLITR